jgi:hypothetical protein
VPHLARSFLDQFGQKKFGHFLGGLAQLAAQNCRVSRLLAEPERFDYELIATQVVGATITPAPVLDCY